MIVKYQKAVNKEFFGKKQEKSTNHLKNAFFTIIIEYSNI